MKSEERHRLNENEVERVLRRVAPVAGDWLQKYGLIAAGIAVLLLIIWGGVTLFSSEDEGFAEGWTDMLSASNASDFETIAEENEGSALANWAKLNQANRQLATGIDPMFSDREGAKLELEEACESFEILLDPSTPGTSPELLERAGFGLATALETRGDADALEKYKRLLEEFPNTIYRDLVEGRIESLEGAGTEEFYAWFSQQNPRPSDRSNPADFGTPPAPVDPFLNTLPEIPDLLKLPDQESDDSEGGPTGTAPPLPEDPAQEQGDAGDAGDAGSPPESDSEDSASEEDPNQSGSGSKEPDQGTPESPEGSR